MKKFLNAVMSVSIVFLLSTSTALAQENSRSSKVPPEIMEMDTNNDKKISKKEAQGKLLEHFNELDKNKDGYVSFEELETMKPVQGGQRGQEGQARQGGGQGQHQGHHEGRPPRQGRPPNNGQHPHGEQERPQQKLPVEFLDLDSNHDNKISKGEAKGRLFTQFDSLDKNHDGYLDFKELQSMGM